MKPSLQEKSAFNYFFLAVFFIDLGLVIYALDKGLDITDETFYALLLNNEVDYNPFFQYGSILHFFISPFTSTIIGFRILRLILTLASSWILFRGILSYIKNHSINLPISQAALFSIISTAGLYSFLTFPKSLSYNSLILIIAEVSIGLLLITNSRWKVHHLILIAACTGFLGVVKLPVTLVLAIIIGLIIIIEGELKNIVKPGIVFLFFTLTFSFLYYLIAEGSVQNILININRGRQLASETGYSLLGLINRYIGGVFAMFQYLSSSFLFWVAILFQATMPVIINNPGRSGYSLIKNKIAAIFYGVLIAISYACLGLGYLNGDLSVLFIPYLFTILPLVFYFIITGFQTMKVNIVFTSIVLLGIPFGLAFGTNNFLQVNALVYIVFFILPVFILYHPGKSGMNTFLINASLSIIVSIMSVQLYSGLFHHLYRSPGIKYLTEKLDDRYNYASGLKVNAELKASFDKLQESLRGTTYKEGDPVFTFSDNIGYGYVINGNFYGPGWFKPTFSYVNQEFKSSYLTLKDPSRIIMIMHDRDKSTLDPDREILKFFKDKNYEEICSFTDPFGETTRVYASEGSRSNRLK